MIFASEPSLQDYDHTVAASIVDRFSRARWIKGTNIVTPSWCRLDYTAAGELGLLRIVRALGAHLPEFGTRTRRRSLVSRVATHVRFNMACLGLGGPALSDTESKLVAAMAVYWYQNQPERGLAVPVS